MTHPKIAALVDTLRENAAAAKDLDGERFQEVVFWVIKSWLFGSQSRGERIQRLSNFLRGEIDIVIELKPDVGGPHFWPPQSGPRRRLHFIECKNYGRPLELDRLGKAYCAAIRYEPESLTIVSSSYLPPQAADYAEAFFRTKPDTVALCENTVFRHLTIEELLNLDHGQPSDSAAPSSERRGAFFDKGNDDYPIVALDWELVAETPWGSEVLARAEAFPPEIVLKSTTSLQLSLWLENLPQRTRATELDLIDLSGNRIKTTSAEVAKWQGNICRIIWSLAPATLSMLGGKELSLRVRLPQLELILPIAHVPEVIVSRDAQLFRDLRPDVTNQLIQTLRHDPNKRIFLLHGTPGVGKSFLAERIAAFLRSVAGWQVERLTLDPLTSPALFLQLIWRSIFPCTSRTRSPGSDSVAQEILRAFLARAIGAREGQAAEELAARLASWDIQDVEMDVLTQLCATIISTDPRPRLVVLGNCHTLSSSILKGLQGMFRALGDHGWGGVRFILEYRDSDEEVSNQWEEFIERIQCDFPTWILRRRIQPLKAEEIEAGIAREFAQPESRKIAVSLVEKAGGNPLFLTQLMLLLLDHRVVRELSTDKFPWRFSVEDQWKFYAKITELPNGVESLLRRRIRFVLNHVREAKSAPPRQDLLEVLAVGAVLSGFTKSQLISKVTSLTADQVRRCCWFFIEVGILRPSHVTSLGEFAHDLLQEAALRESAADISFKPLMLRLENSVGTQSIEDCLLGGKITLLLSDPGRAEGWYSMSYELATAARDFTSQRSSLAGILASLNFGAAENTASRRRTLAVKQELAFWEMMTGSQIEARRLLRELLDQTRSIGTELHVTEVQSVRLEAYFSLLTLLARRRAVGDFLATCEEAVGDASQIRHMLLVLTRFTIIAGVCSYPEAAHAAALLALDATSKPGVLAPLSTNRDLLSTVLHDIGDLFLAARPNEALRFFGLSLDRASSPRQALNCRVTQAIARLHAGGEFLGNLDLKEITNEVTNARVPNLAVRWDLYMGVRASSMSDLETALFYFRRAVDRSLSANLTLHEWEGYNNLAVIHASVGQDETATEYLLRALLRAAEILKYAAARRDRLSSTLQLIKTSLESLPEWRGDLLPTQLPNKADWGPSQGSGISLPPPPPYSGQAASLVWNTTKWGTGKALGSHPKLRHWVEEALCVKEAMGIQAPNPHLQARTHLPLVFALE